MTMSAFPSPNAFLPQKPLPPPLPFSSFNNMYYYSVILDDIIHRYGLQPLYHMQPQHTRHGVVHTATVSVDGLTAQSTDYDQGRAQEQAAHDAISALERRGFLRRHFKTELNNIARKYQLRVDYENSYEGRPDRRTHTSIVTINGTPEGHPGKASRGSFAEELAAKTVVESLEARNYRL